MTVDLSKVLTHILRTPAERKEWGLSRIDKSSRQLYDCICATQCKNIASYMKKMGMKEKPRKERTSESTEVKDVFYTTDVVEICYLVMQLVNAGLICDPVNQSNPHPSNRAEVYLSHETKYRIKV